MKGKTRNAWDYPDKNITRDGNKKKLKIQVLRTIKKNTTNVTSRKQKALDQLHLDAKLQHETSEKSITVPNNKVENFQSLDFFKIQVL